MNRWLTRSTGLPEPAAATRPGPLQRLFRRGLLRSLEMLAEGEILLREGGGERRFGRAARDPSLRARILVQSPRTYTRLALGGIVGAGDSFVRGEWSCDDLTALVRILVRNERARGRLDGGAARLAEPARRVLHALRSDTRRGSRRNIAAHYDIGNDFFEQLLDETLTYSCGVFEREGDDLAAASRAKYERIGRKLGLSPRDHVLEIGGGWGGFAIHAALRFGCRVTSITISRAQHALARRRVAECGLAGRVTVELCDYRDVRGRFDALVSIEMIEAVGHAYLDTFFEACSARLAPHGRMALQAITIADRHYERARHSVDFVKRYVFPGGCLPSLGAIADCAARTDLQITGLEDLTPHYAETLRRWRARLVANGDTIRGLGYSDELQRMWHFYLSYCEAGFEERRTGLVQVVLEKPRAQSGARLALPSAAVSARAAPSRAA